MRALAVVGFGLGFAACGSEAVTTALFAMPAEADEFYALPFPNDLRRHADGTLDLSAFPTNGPFMEKFRAVAEQLDGFGLNQPVFARFDGALDPASLPDPAGSILDDASVYLVDIDPDSAAHGSRTPIVVTFRERGTQTLGANNLVARPYPGFGLDDGTTYALVITKRVRDAGNVPVAAASAFAQILGSDETAAIAQARTVYQPLLDYLDEDGGDARADVASAAVFTTQHATTIVPAIRKAIHAAPAPVASQVVKQLADPTLRLFHGSYDAANFQRGVVPYREAGDIVMGPDGVAIVQRTEPMRFALTVPTSPMPAAGYPIVVYAHGSGGSFETFVTDGTGRLLAEQGIATISTDQVLHGPRNPDGNPQLDFFNFANPLALRDNVLQGTADLFSLHRLATTMVLTDGTPITFDPSKTYFFGHSQGGLISPGYVAFEPAVTGAVFSGTAGLLSLALLNGTQPVDLPGLLSSLIRDEPLDIDNPSIALMQLWMERSDGINYARFIVRHPVTDPAGNPLPPRNVFQTEGFSDHISANVAMQAFAVALGADLANVPGHQEFAGLALRGRAILPTPITGNVGSVTCVLAQYSGPDGHNVTFDVALARLQTTQFLGRLVRTGQATVVSPP